MTAPDFDQETETKVVWHISTSSGLAKTILQGTVQEKRRKGTRKIRCEDNIKEWTGMDFASSTRAAEDRIRWKGIVVKSSMAPTTSQGYGID